MQLTRITNTDLRPSRLCLGLAPIGVKMSEAESFALLDRFCELGGNFLDTARVYSDWVAGETGRSERILGDWLAARKNRSQLVIATKGGHPPLGDLLHPRMDKAEVVGDIAKSLKALRIDCIDLYYLHRDDPARPVGQIMDYLNEFASAGLIRYFGCSNWQADRIRQAYEYCSSKGLRFFVANQMHWNVGSFYMRQGSDTTMARMDKAMFDLHRQTGMAAVPYSSQAGGFFSKLLVGRDDPKKPLDKYAYNTPENLLLAKVIDETARRLGISISAVVLAYLLHQPITVIPVVGCHTIEQLEDSVKALDCRLDEQARRQIASACGLGS
ncbi:MAG: aldo/keto reductase [Planctomycetes bacterium]|nr:aldo/keto reductase [Planctomycetota bacterium]